MMNRLLSILLVTLFLGTLHGQTVDFEHLSALKWRDVGPAGMSGRVTSIDVNLQDKEHIIVGTASGGVWESKNGGISWNPIFDDQPTLSIGSVCFNQKNPAEIWVGTGEGNPRNSHNSGAGVFKSIDGGKSWKYMGLRESKLIHRIIVHEDDSNTIFVGALGNAWGPSEHRGVYKSSDGGETWDKILYNNEQTGVADMVVDPSNPNKILVAMWEFGRTPWNFNSGGKGSGIYLTYDAGANWKKLSKKEGLPGGTIGRCGLAFSASNPNIAYALVEAKENALYKTVNGGEKWYKVSSKNIGNRPFYYADIYVDPKNENRIYNLWSYLSKSEDGGKTFTTIADYGNSVHPDHHAFWIDPDDPNYLINGNDGGLNISRDGAKTWRFVANLPVGQFYHVEIDNDFPYNIYGGMQDNGSWVGPGFVLKRGGIRNYDWQELYFGDGFDVAPRRSDTRYGYAMSQEGNLAHYDRLTGRTSFIQPQHPEGEKLRYNWNAALALDPFNDCGLYYGSQYVHYSDDCGASWNIISPDLTTNDTIKQNQSKSGGLTLDITGAENHTTILAIAPSKTDRNLIFASTDDGQLHVSRDGGGQWTNLRDRLPGLPEHCWIPQIILSDINEGEVFVVVNNYRMDDWSAYLYHSADNGETWTRIVDDSDVGGFVCSMIQDYKNENLLFLGTDVGLYVSFDHGQEWQKWEKTIPSVQIRDIKIQKQFDDLVLGTFGRSFMVFDDIKFLRSIASGDSVLHQQFKVFETSPVYQTSSRSYDGIRFVAQGEFIGDNKWGGAILTIWNKPKEEKKADPVTEKKEEKKGKNSKTKNQKKKKDKLDESAEGELKEQNKESKKKKKRDSDQMEVAVINSSGDTVRTFKRKLKEGMNRISWYPDQKGVDYPRKTDPREKREPGGMPIFPGAYKLVFKYNNHIDSTMLEIKTDPREDESNFDTQAKYDAMEDFNATITACADAIDNLKAAKKSQGVYLKLIEAQEDTIKKDMMKRYKNINNQIDSLMNLYFLPESKKTEYRDNSNTLGSKLGMARNFLRTSTAAPTPNGMNAVRTAERAAKEVIEGVNQFFESEWSPYIKDLEEMPMEIFKNYNAVKIE